MAKEKITADIIKNLRERTGVGMSKCKEALEKSSGDIEKAIDILRKEGVASAVKKEGRETKAGSIFFIDTPQRLALVELNAETDFVVQNNRFQQFAHDIGQDLVKTNPKSLEEFFLQPYSKDTSLTIDQYRAVVMQSFGENIRIRRFEVFSKSPNTTIGTYSHMWGKIVAVVEIEGSSGLEDLAKSIGMHIVAMSPAYLTPADVPKEVVAREEEVARGQVIGKPQAIVDKIVEGKLASFYDAICLLGQKFIKDTSLTIDSLMESQGKSIGKSLKIVRFVCWHVGEKLLDG